MGIGSSKPEIPATLATVQDRLDITKSEDEKQVSISRRGGIHAGKCPSILPVQFPSRRNEGERKKDEEGGLPRRKMRRSDFQSDYGARAEQVPDFAQTPPKSNVVLDGAGEAF